MHRVGRIFCRKASNPIHGCKGLCPRRIRWRFGSFAGIAVFLFFGAACTEIIHVDLGTMDSILVVDAKLTTDTASHVVKLNRSCDYYDPEVDKTTISGALVYVQREDGSRIDYVYCTRPLYDRIVSARVVSDEYTTPVRDPQELRNFWHPSDHRPIIIDFDMR